VVCFGGSREIERTGRTGSGTLDHVEVNHGGGDVGMAEQRLYRANIDPTFE
jgi:hypothetical protein